MRGKLAQSFLDSDITCKRQDRLRRRLAGGDPGQSSVVLVLEHLRKQKLPVTGPPRSTPTRRQITDRAQRGPSSSAQRAAFLMRGVVQRLRV
jgi:hypothetical protein